MKSQWKILYRFLCLCRKVRRVVDSSFAKNIELNFSSFAVYPWPATSLHSLCGGWFWENWHSIQGYGGPSHYSWSGSIGSTLRTGVTHQSSRRLAFLAEGSRWRWASGSVGDKCDQYHSSAWCGSPPQQPIHEMLFDWKKSLYFVFKTPHTSDSCQLKSWSTFSDFWGK